MDSVFICAQIIGFCAMCFSVTAWQVKEPRKIYALYVPSSLLWSFQYILLGAPVGAIIAICSASKDAGLAFANPNHKKYFVSAYIVLVVGFGAYYFQSWISLFPILAALSLNATILLTDKKDIIARAVILSQIFFILYNLNTGAWMAVVCSVLVIVSSIIGMARHEEWDIGRCYKSFAPSLMRSLLIKPQTYP
jgi:hypothetical protein